MGLDTSHNCWHGAYGAFNRWRTEVCKLAGLPPLELMEGFYQAIPNTEYQDPIHWAQKGLNDETAFSDLKSRLPIKWESLKPSALHKLLYHSDCDGELLWQDCDAISDELETVLTRMKDEDAGGHIGNWKDKTQTFIDGLRLASKNKENVEFH